MLVTGTSAHAFFDNSVVLGQAVNVRGFHASMNPRFEGGILHFMDGIPDFI